MLSLFRPGDRVKTRRPIHTIPAGSTGTVILVLLSARDVYLVRFDDYPGAKIVRGGDLEPALPPAASLRAA
jgi:hypothetical protein